MQPVKHFLSAVTLTLLSAPAFAASTVYTTPGSFLTHVESGSYTENFDALGLPPLGPLDFSGGAFAYTVSAPSDLYSNLSSGFLGAGGENEPLKVQFTSGNVTAVGANFFATDINDAFVSVQVTLTLSDGTVESFTPTTAGSSFRGFVSSAPITSLVFSAPGASAFAGLDNLTVGMAVPVPEPASMALLGLGVAFLFGARRRMA